MKRLAIVGVCLLLAACTATHRLVQTTSTKTTAPTASSQAPTASSRASASPTHLKTVTIGSWTGAKPRTIWFSGDAGNIVTNISWSSWGPDSGVGRGTWHYDNCVPSCAQGTVTDYSARITVSHPSAGQFTRLIEAQSGPHGQTYTFTLPDRGLGGASSGTDFDK